MNLKFVILSCFSKSFERRYREYEELIDLRKIVKRK